MKNIDDDLSLLDLWIHEAGDLVQNLSADYVFAQHYTLVAMHTTIGLDSGDVHPSQSFSMLLEKLGPTK